MKKKLFISYSKDNHEVAKRLLMHLENQNANSGNSLEFFLDTRRLESGFQWDPVIQQHLKCSHGYVFLVSIDSLSSSYIKTNELPAMAFGHIVHHCPIYLFLVSKCGIKNYTIRVDGIGNSLVLGGLEITGPKQDSGRPAWYNELPQEKKESALSQAADVICKGMKNRNIQLPSECLSQFEDRQILKPASPVKPQPKPVLDNYLIFLDRKNVINPLNTELPDNLIVAISATGKSDDWFEGLALRLCYKNTPRQSGQTGENTAQIGKPADYNLFKIDWPHENNISELREKSLWGPLFEKNGISLSQGEDKAFEILWKKINTLLQRERRIVIHYLISMSDSDLNKDKALALLLAEKWKTFSQSIEGNLQGRLILLFSINQNIISEEDMPFWKKLLPGTKKPVTADDLMGQISMALTGINMSGETNQGCYAFQGGELKKINYTDIDINWKSSIKATGFEDEKISKFILFVESVIPKEGKPLFELRQELKQNPDIKGLFKVT